MILMRPRDTIEAFDSFLLERGLSLEAVVIGGAALGLLGVVSRQTRDCDILHPLLPKEIRDAAMEFAVLRRAEGEALDDDWLNNGPASLADDLPDGWNRRLQVAFSGKAIILRSLGRMDLLQSKVFALCDRGIDIQDCIALKPTAAELDELLPWLKVQDANPMWPDHVGTVLGDLKKRLGHGL
jgi:hypothetical protein